MEPTLSSAPPEPLSADECLRLLEFRQVGRIALILNGRLEILPMTYRLFQGAVVIRTACDTDLAMAHGQLIAFEVDDIDEDARTGWSVVVHGTAEEIQRTEELSDLRVLPLRLWAYGHRERYLRVLPTTLTGRRVSHDHDYNLVGRPDVWYG